MERCEDPPPLLVGSQVVKHRCGQHDVELPVGKFDFSDVALNRRDASGGRPADPLLGPPTLSVGRIEGGSSVNTVPDRCRIEVDRRLISGEDPDDVPGQLADFLRREGNVELLMVK